MIDVLELLDIEEKRYSGLPAPSVTRQDSTVPVEATKGICFEIDRSVLKALLEKAIDVVPSKEIIPVLKNFEIRVREGSLTVVGTNLNSSIVVSTTMSLQVSRTGKDVFPARKLLDIVRESDSRASVFIEVLGRAAIIVAGSASWQINLGNGKDFPSMPKVSAENLDEVSRAEFLRALSTVRYAVHTGGRESLSVVQIKKGRFTACDGNRLQQARIEGFSLEMLIPGISVDALVKLLKSSDVETLRVGEVDNKLIFCVGSDILILNKIATTFPPLEQLWLRPAMSNDFDLRVEKSLLVDALRRVRVSVDAEYSVVTALLKSGQAGRLGEMELTARDAEGNVARETVPIQWDDKKHELIFHYRHMMELLNHYPQNDCLFLLGEDQKTKKSSILLKDEERFSIGIIHQMAGVPASLRNPQN